MEKVNIRSATLDDVAQLAELKSTYVRRLYRGFISQDILNRSTPAFHASMISSWLESGLYRIVLTERDGQICQYLVYGSNPEEPYNGLIYEGVCSDPTEEADKRMLVEYCLRDLRAMGHTCAYLWVLVDNFRVRFLFENLGFRPDGARDTRHLFDQDLRIARYQYKLV